MPGESPKDYHSIKSRIQRICKPYPNSVDRCRLLYFLDSSYVQRDRNAPVVRMLGDFCETFDVSFSEVRIIGSATLGVSFHKQTVYAPESSDVDIAISSEAVYAKLLRSAVQATDGFTDNRKFTPDDLEVFKYSTLQGYIDPIRLPQCGEKDRWVQGLRDLSSHYIRHFSEITATVYCGFWFLEHKTASYIKKYLG